MNCKGKVLAGRSAFLGLAAGLSKSLLSTPEPFKGSFFFCADAMLLIANIAEIIAPIKNNLFTYFI
jgi:hypothetical protein